MIKYPVDETIPENAYDSNHFKRLMGRLITLNNIPSDVPRSVLKRLLDENKIFFKNLHVDETGTSNGARQAHVEIKDDRFTQKALRILNECEIAGQMIDAFETDAQTAERLQSQVKRDEPAAETRAVQPPEAPQEPEKDYSEYCVPFDSLPLSETTLNNIREKGFEKTTPIQGMSIQPIMEGRDIIGRAQTGSGKTLAFMIPIVERLLPDPGKGMRALILAPTRELAIQIKQDTDVLIANTDIESIVLYGGEHILDQIVELKRDIDIVIATPGRLLDLQGRGRLRIDACEMLVLDEADRMLAMGFMPQIQSILRCFYEHPQTLMFSATLPKEVTKLIKSYLHDPLYLEVGNRKLTAIDSIEQQVEFVEDKKKVDRLKDLLKGEEGTVIVFTRTKRATESLAQQLKNAGFHVTRIHGDIDQSDRLKAVESFRSGRHNILVATDVAARGLHIENIAHIVNFDLAQTPEDHLHRIGRTGRAGASGKATTFITPSEKRQLKAYKGVLGKALQ